MTISMYQASTPRFVNILRNLSAILEKAKAAHWGFRSLVHEIVQSRLFLEK